MRLLLGFQRVFGESFLVFLRPLGVLFGLLGLFWEPLGASWGDLGPSWGEIGVVMGDFWSPSFLNYVLD